MRLGTQMWPTGMGCMSADGPVPQDLAVDAAQSVQMFSHWLTRQPQLKTLVSHEAPLYGLHVQALALHPMWLSPHPKEAWPSFQHLTGPMLL